MPILDQEKALKALELGQIRQDQYDRMGFTPEGPELPPDLELPPEEPIAGPQALPPVDQFDDPLASQRAFWQQKKAKEDSAVAGAEQRRQDAQLADQARKRDAAVKMGYSREEIDRNLPPVSAFAPPNESAPTATYDDPYLTLATDRDQMDIDALMARGANYPGAGAYGEIRAGIQAQGDALREHSREQATEYQNAMDRYESINKDQDVKTIAQNKQSQTFLNDLETMRSDLASTKIEKRDLFANAGTGEKIAAWASLILGGFGGRGNQAVDVLNRAVDRDVELQKANYGIKKEGLQNKESLYGRMLQKFGNENAAFEATRSQLFKVAELKLAQLGARYQDTATKGKIQEELGKLQLLQEQAKAAFLNSLMGGDDPYKNLDEKQGKRLVPGYGFAPNEKLADIGVAATTMADNTISNIGTILTKAKKAGRFDIGANDEISQLVALLRSENREAILGPGTVQAAERELIADLIKDPSGFFTNRVRAQKALEVIRDAAGRTRDNKLKSIGVRPRGSRYRTLEYQQ